MPTVDTVPPRVFKLVEKLLHDYRLHKTIVANYERARQDIIERSRQWEPGIGDGPQGVPADPTGRKVAELEALEARTGRSRQVLAIIDAVWDILSDEKRRILELKYFAKDKLTNEQVIAEMHIGRSRFYAQRKEIIRDFAFVMGLLWDDRDERREHSQTRRAS